MSPGEWVSAIVAVVGLVGGFAGWMTALWIRAGRILERVDVLTTGHKRTTTKVETIDRRLTRAEVILDGLK